MYVAIAFASLMILPVILGLMIHRNHPTPKILDGLSYGLACEKYSRGQVDWLIREGFLELDDYELVGLQRHNPRYASPHAVLRRTSWTHALED